MNGQDARIHSLAGHAAQVDVQPGAINLGDDDAEDEPLREYQCHGGSKLQLVRRLEQMASGHRPYG